MRPLALALLVLAALAGARRVHAEEPEALRLQVGEETWDLGVMPRCDDLPVVAVTASGRGVRGLRAGETLCSFDRSGGGGIRRVYRIVVRPATASPARPDAPAPKGN